MIRLQKLLAEAGFGSRRTVESWIKAGRVTIAGRPARLGDRAAPGDDVRLDGRKLEVGRQDAPRLLLYYKPLGEVTTRRDPEGRPTVFERLPAPRQGRWINVGRLDVNTSGLLLLTTDGDLAHRLMHPSSEVEREYLVRVRGSPGPEAIQRLLKGVTLEDGPACFDRVLEDRDSGNAGRAGSFRVVIREGRKHEVRRMWSAVGFEVSALVRVRYGPAELPPGLRPGQYREGGAELLDALRAAASKYRAKGALTP
jgi:23S rRNA pseudouridine2605 synthase